MGYNNYANYSNAYRGNRDDLTNQPLSLPFDSQYFNTDGTLKDGVKLSGEVLKQLRQHVKAIHSNFTKQGTRDNDFPGTPNAEAIPDAELAPGQEVESEHFNEGATPTGTNNALLDEMAEIGILGAVSATADGQPITKSKIDEIAAQLKSAATYSNYSNYFNSHANYKNGYANHSQHSNYTATNRGWMCHRNHGNHSNTSSGSNHLNTSVNYGNYANYGDHTNTAVYQDNL